MHSAMVSPVQHASSSWTGPTDEREGIPMTSTSRKYRQPSRSPSSSRVSGHSRSLSMSPDCRSRESSPSQSPSPSRLTGRRRA